MYLCITTPLAASKAMPSIGFDRYPMLDSTMSAWSHKHIHMVTVEYCKRMTDRPRTVPYLSTQDLVREWSTYECPRTPDTCHGSRQMSPPARSHVPLYPQHSGNRLPLLAEH